MTAKHPNSVPPQIVYPPGPIEHQANTVPRGMLFGGGGLHHLSTALFALQQCLASSAPSGLSSLSARHERYVQVSGAYRTLQPCMPMRRPLCRGPQLGEPVNSICFCTHARFEAESTCVSVCVCVCACACVCAKASIPVMLKLRETVCVCARVCFELSMSTPVVTPALLLLFLIDAGNHSSQATETPTSVHTEEQHHRHACLVGRL